MNEIPHYNILLVEDHAPNAAVASTIIDSLGYSYIWAANGAEGIEKFKSHKFDLVLMDLRMPDLSGTETTKQMRAIEKEKKLPRIAIIAMTAHIATSDMNECANADMDDIITKPPHPTYFSKMLRKYCQNQPVKKQNA